MSEREICARPTGQAAVALLRSVLDTAEFQVREFTKELNHIQGCLEKAKIEAAELRQGLSILAGGDNHEG